MKNLIQNLVPSKLTYKLACLCMIAMFAGNTQASIIHYDSPESNNFGGFHADIVPMSHTDLEIDPGMPYLPSNQITVLHNPNYQLDFYNTAQSLSFDHTTDVAAWFIFNTDQDSVTDFGYLVIKELFMGPTFAFLGGFLTNPIILGLVNDALTSFGITLPFPILPGIEGTGAFDVTDIHNIVPISGYIGPIEGTLTARVPEPTSLLLLLTGMFGVSAAKRRNKGMMATAA